MMANLDLPSRVNVLKPSLQTPYALEEVPDFELPEAQMSLDAAVVNERTHPDLNMFGNPAPDALPAVRQMITKSGAVTSLSLLLSHGPLVYYSKLSVGLDHGLDGQVAPFTALQPGSGRSLVETTVGPCDDDEEFDDEDVADMDLKWGRYSYVPEEGEYIIKGATDEEEEAEIANLDLQWGRFRYIIEGATDEEEEAEIANLDLQWGRFRYVPELNVYQTSVYTPGIEVGEEEASGVKEQTEEEVESENEEDTKTIFDAFALRYSIGKKGGIASRATTASCDLPPYDWNASECPTSRQSSVSASPTASPRHIPRSVASF